MYYCFFQIYIPILLMFVLLILMAGAILLLSHLLGPRRPSRERLATEESDGPAKREALSSLHVGFYRVAIAFVLFNAVVVFFYLWAVVFHQLRMYGFLAILFYLLFLAPGYLYLWKQGVFDLSRTSDKGQREP
jgi:NADH-quinone oxidoreductase subunit A